MWENNGSNKRERLRLTKLRARHDGLPEPISWNIDRSIQPTNQRSNEPPTNYIDRFETFQSHFQQSLPSFLPPTTVNQLLDILEAASYRKEGGIDRSIDRSISSWSRRNTPWKVLVQRWEVGCCWGGQRGWRMMSDGCVARRPRTNQNSK